VGDKGQGDQLPLGSWVLRARVLSMGIASTPSRVDRRGVVVGSILVVLVLIGVYIGSSGLQWFDPALAPYLFGTVLAVFATAYRYIVWLRRPPTAMLNSRGWEAMRAKGRRGSNAVGLVGKLVNNILLQRFIAGRSKVRWVAHQLLFWGCVLAALVTFPLTFGWLHFESADESGRLYEAFLGPFATIQFDSRGFFGFMVFHLLNIAAFLVIAGVAIFLIRRMRDRGAIALERASDFAPLVGLFAVSITGLMLTASSLWMGGQFYAFITNLHALTVILGLLYIPFGKLFHIFQRPANIGVSFYKEAAEATGEQTCIQCGEGFASVLQMEDLKAVLPAVGFDYSFESGEHYQDVCPKCRRRVVGLAQVARVGGFG